MDHLATQILAVIKANPGWAMFMIGLTAFGESFMFLSLLFPGTAILVAAGTLVSAGILNPVSSVIAGIVGAVLGDSISFWLGDKFGPFLPKIWPFGKRPELLTNGIRFFERYGGSSVFIGRFFGPLRAIVPLAAGMMHMPTSRFYVANILYSIRAGLGANACAFWRGPGSVSIWHRKYCDEDLLYRAYRRSCDCACLLGAATNPHAVRVS